MKKTIAIIGSAAALSFSGAGLAAAQGLPDTGSAPTGSLGAAEDAPAGTPTETPAEVSALAEQLCGTIDAYDFLGSAEGVVPGLAGEDCEATAASAVAAAFSGDIAGALDILRGIDAGVPGDDADVPGDDESEDSSTAVDEGDVSDAGA